MIEIKRASKNDAQTLTNLGISTFVETFAKDNRKDDMDLYIVETFHVDKQLKEIQDPNRFIEIAWLENKAVGFLHLLKGVPDPSVSGPNPVEILRLYVESHLHGKGVGAALMQRCVQLARDNGFQTLWLGVWERNLRAQSFYEKYGFIKVGQHDFRLGNDVQVDLIMTRCF